MSRTKRIYAATAGRSVGGRGRLRPFRLGCKILQLLNIGLDLAPLRGFALGGVGRVRVGIEVEQFRAQVGRHIRKILGGELLQQLGVRIVVYEVDTETGGFAYMKMVVD